jgi:hypothetical protein
MVNLSHDNVMRLEGICFDQDENGNLDPRLILPFLANGDLSKYVRNQPVSYYWPTVTVTFKSSCCLPCLFILH